MSGTPENINYPKPAEIEISSHAVADLSAMLGCARNMGCTGTGVEMLCQLTINMDTGVVEKVAPFIRGGKMVRAMVMTKDGFKPYGEVYNDYMDKTVVAPFKRLDNQWKDCRVVWDKPDTE